MVEEEEEEEEEVIWTTFFSSLYWKRHFESSLKHVRSSKYHDNLQFSFMYKCIATRYMLDGKGIESFGDEIFRASPKGPQDLPSLTYTLCVLSKKRAADVTCRKPTILYRRNYKCFVSLPLPPLCAF